MKDNLFNPDMVDYITQTWVALEISFQSTKEYKRPFCEAKLDALFTSPNGQEIRMPGFWDGDNDWKIRFAPTCPGIWKYKTFCTDPMNESLNGHEGTIGVTVYKGDLAIYIHGFLITRPGYRYLMYNDGLPFFYIGDTHWSMCKEPYDEMFTPLIDQRVAQGFTVYQSEPISVQYRLADGLTQNAIPGFKDMDRRFKYIADSGLVHANAQLFFTSELQKNMLSSKYSDDDLRELARYWVARYAAYPVLWTTAQEADDDFHEKLDVDNNRWKTVFNAIHQYDPYQHPQSAHQEGDHKTAASNSQFKDLPGYTWFAAQTHTNKSGPLGLTGYKDFWNHSGQRPVVAYESHYENLWTNDFGARQQGWVFLLSGMCGHGYGAQDIWLYDSEYDEDKDTVIGDITITKEMKKVTWKTTRYCTTALQMATYMKGFLCNIEWWKLTPRFDDTDWFVSTGGHYSIATIGNNVYVVYFYNQTIDTGILKNLTNDHYKAQWYNPRTDQYEPEVTITPKNGNHPVGHKPDGNDWVYIVKPMEYKE
jgi:hypothetical protein